MSAVSHQDIINELQSQLDAMAKAYPHAIRVGWIGKEEARQHYRIISKAKKIIIDHAKQQRSQSIDRANDAGRTDADH
jgi:hypothetical protein